MLLQCCMDRLARPAVLVVMVIVVMVCICSLTFSSVLQLVNWNGEYHQGPPHVSRESGYIQLTLAGNFKPSEYLTGLQQDKGSLYSNEEGHDITELSLNPDIDARGQWQMEQVDAYCQKYHLEKVAYTLPESRHIQQNLYRHLIFDDSRKLLFCFVPKVGCTNMRRFLFALQGIIPEESIHWETVDEHEYLAPGIQRASFLNKSLTDEERLYKIKNYYKFMIVRNPLERLLSAFKDKIEKPLNLTEFDMPSQIFDRFKEEILMQYRKDEFSRWFASDRHVPVQVTFSEYIRWVVDTEHDNLNEHFAPTISNSHPCRIKYNFYGNFKMYNSDIAGVARRLRVPFEYFYNKSSHSPSTETRNLLDSYYSQVDKKLKQRLLQSFSDELDFYYHLYPEERTTI